MRVANYPRKDTSISQYWGMWSDVMRRQVRVAYIRLVAQYADACTAKGLLVTNDLVHVRTVEIASIC